ncbi:MAG: DHH family phosphoesterase [Candidatus Micrarchaeota archaeon]|nr:DHH family phosphoesterase [Candidatus Micrarchaeota archaeon]
MANQQAFLDRCLEAKEAASRMRAPLIIHHYDCDGLSSGALAASWFEEQDRKYSMRAVRKLDEALIKELVGEPEIIFVDLGSGSPFIEELKGNVIVIDHHQPQHKSHLQANPHLFGFDGGSELSAAGCAYFVFRTSVDLGIVGAVGDIQYPLRSLNRIMLEEGISQGKVSSSTDLRLFGRNSRPLKQLLLYADEPYLPGLTGQEDGCDGFLSGFGIPQKTGDKWRTYSDLSLEEKKQLVSALAQHLSSRSSPEASSRLVGEVYTLLSRPQGTELSDASEFSTLLNACGRNNRAELGVAVCLSRAGAYEESQLLLAEHRKNLRAGISFAVKNTQDFGKFLLLDARGIISDSIIGVVAGMVHPGSRLKPILALSLEEEGKIKLSTRGTRQLVEAGLNLGKILSEACAAVGGVGGGHNIAAGATIPENRLDDFLLEFASRL